MGFSKAETINKQKKLVSKSQRNKRRVLVNVFKIILVVFITLIISVAGACFGMIKGILDNAPDINEISFVPKGYKTHIYDQDGNVTREISTIGANREYVYLEDVSENMINAIVAIEDERFWTHNGIDIKGIFRAGVKGIISGSFDEGASTITQQLIKNAVFNVGLDETTFMDQLERKIQEQYLALELEKRYDKNQILELYLNTIYLGRGTNGVQSASKLYFNKEVKDLTISEAAALAGITQNPSAYDPIEFPENSARRREDVLDKMLELEYITQAEYDIAMADDVYARIAQNAHIQQEESAVYSYYEDAIIDQLILDFMEIYNCSENEAAMMIYTGGYSVYSVQDMDIQKICDDAVNDDSYIDGAKVGLDYRLTIIGSDKEEHNYSMENMISYFKVTTGNDKYNNIYDSEESARAAANEYKEYILDSTGGTLLAESFSVSPQPQFSFTILDQKTGYVKAIVGGKGEKKVDRGLNRATNSPRQPGSTFKIVAAYLPLFDTDQGGLATTLKDEEYKFGNGTVVNNWWGATYRGYNSVRRGIADSMNVLAVKTIDWVTPQVAYDYVSSLGFTTLEDGTKVGADGTVLTDVTQSLSLGGLTYGVTTYEMSAAYASIANGGVYTKPVLYSKVLDHDGNVVIDNTNPEARQRRVMKETTAWQLIEGMRTVVSGGSGGPARMSYGIDHGGKTGTTSSRYDLWFAGMTPYYTAAIWMGFDYNTRMSGTYAHEYMWADIMDRIAEHEQHDKSKVIMERPSGIVTVKLCQITNQLPGENCPTTSDYMAATAVPSKRCEGHDTIDLCLDSNKLATENCPNKVTYVVEEVIDPNTKEPVKELVGVPKEQLELHKYTEDVCDLHPETGKFKIETSAGPGGTISNSVEAPAGSDVTIYITPSTGYAIKEVLVNGQSVGAVSSYKISNISSNVKISVTFKKGSAPPQPPASTDTTTEATTTEATTTEATTTEATTTEATTTETPTTETPTETPPETQ